MESATYEVVYIDKFKGLPSAGLLRERIGKAFGLSEKNLARISSGTPVVIKKRVGLEEAKKYQQAIRDLAGVCWIQSLDAEGGHRDRRQQNRRAVLDRRSDYRGSSILPDRRSDCGRRSSDP